MIVLDAYALVALLGEEHAADDVEALLRRGACAVGVVNLAETIDVVSRVHGLALEEVREALGTLILGGQLRVLVPEPESAWRAAALRQRYYAKGRCELSLADCFLLSGAGVDDEIATSDAPVANVARAEGLRIVALPDSTGRRP